MIKKRRGFEGTRSIKAVGSVCVASSFRLVMDPPCPFIPSFCLVDVFVAGISSEGTTVQVRQPLAGVEQKNSPAELHEAGEGRQA